MKSILTISEQSLAKEIVVDAGKRLLKLKHTALLSSKNYGHISADIQTQADIDTENLLQDHFSKHFPKYGFYSEETAKENTSELTKETVWIVDPIDGTLNFSRQLPFYGISVGLFYQNKPLYGLIYFPATDELYSAYKGQGAYLGKTRLRIANRKSAKELYLVIGHIGLSALEEGRLQTRLVENGLNARSFGCSIYHLSHTASGQIDICVGINQAIWDLAAGWIIIEEAGGNVKIFNNENLRQKAGNPYHVCFVAGNHYVVDWLIPKLKRL